MMRTFTSFYILLTLHFLHLLTSCGKQVSAFLSWFDAYYVEMGAVICTEIGAEIGAQLLEKCNQIMKSVSFILSPSKHRKRNKFCPCSQCPDSAHFLMGDARRWVVKEIQRNNQEAIPPFLTFFFFLVRCTLFPSFFFPSQQILINKFQRNRKTEKQKFKDKTKRGKK